MSKFKVGLLALSFFQVFYSFASQDFDTSERELSLNDIATLIRKASEELLKRENGFFQHPRTVTGICKCADDILSQSILGGAASRLGHKKSLSFFDDNGRVTKKGVEFSMLFGSLVEDCDCSSDTQDCAVVTCEEVWDKLAEDSGTLNGLRYLVAGKKSLPAHGSRLDASEVNWENLTSID